LGVAEIYYKVTATMRTTELNLGSFAENTQDGILIKHEDRLVYANRVIEEMLGYIPGELLDSQPDTIISIAPPGQGELENNDGKAFSGRYETSLRRKDGSPFPADITNVECTWHDMPAQVFIVRDITEAKGNETALREIETRFHQLTKSIREVFFVRDLSSNQIIYISPAYEDIWKRPASALQDDPLDFIAIIHPDDRERVLETMKRHNENKQGFHNEYRIVWPSGEIRWIRSRTFPILDETGRAHQVAGIAEDFTEQKIAEEKLRLSELQLRQIIDLVPHAIFVKDREGRFLLVNKAKADFYGTTVDRLTEALQSDIHSRKDQVERMQFDDRAVLDLNRPKLIPEEEVVDAAGNRHILQTIKIPFIGAEGGPTAILGVSTDITERKRVENALSLSEERLRRSLHYANIGNWDWNIQTNALYWSEPVARLFGYEGGVEETTYSKFLDAVHPDDRQLVEDAVKDCVESGRDYDIEHRVVWPDGTLHWLHESGGVVYDEEERAIRMLGVVRDITRSKLAEQALMESEQKYRVVMENASDAILLGTMSGWIIDANRRAEELLSYSRDELLKMHGTAIHPKEEHPTLVAAFQDLATKGSSLYEHLVLRKDGSVVNAEVAATTIEYQGKKIVMAIFRDITARKLAEQERLTLAKAQRDTLVREVHHRIKNNLQGVMGLLRQHSTKHPDLRAPLESAIHQVNSMAVVHGLYSQNSGDHVVLCEMVTAICLSAHGLTGKMIEPHLTVDVESPIHVSSDEAVPLALILNELIFNAVKHQAAQSQSIQVKVQDEPDGARVRIVTPDTCLPQNFDFATGAMLGTGLKLVKSLLPPSGCHLRISNESSGVVAELLLGPPVIITLPES
jgi:PAS domain S-box-containing protein